MEVTLLYSNTRGDPNIPCPQQTNTDCLWLDFPAADATYKIQVQVTNKPKQQTVSVPFACKVTQNIKPGPIENLSIVSERPGCLVISWTHPRENRSKVYRIKHTNVLIDNLTNSHYNSCEYNTSEFRPYTHYNFSVDCLPSGIYAGYFSDPVSQDFWTPMTAPDLGPSATNGSFTSTLCVDGHRNVTLMWQSVDPEARNGIITSYQIRSGHESWISTTFSATVILTCDPVSVAILAFNPEGFSVSPTILLISSSTVSKTVQNSFVVEIVNMNSTTEILKASWEEKEEVKGEVDYTIFWCKGRLEQFCEGEIQWSEVPAGDTEFSILIESSHAVEYIYGISGTNTHTGIASSVFWTPCLFRRVPYTLPPITAMNVKSLKDSVYVTWSADSCYYQSQVRYTSFVVKWCRTDACNDASQISNATVPVRQLTYTVSSLPAGVNHSFTVQPMSYNTPGREVDPWKVAVPSATDPVVDSNLTAVLGGLASGVLVVTVVTFVCRCCQKRRAKIKKLGDTLIVHLPGRSVSELGSPLE
ncbi:unnamed protein product [Candidula unifasciata]|uniref:Fibronectin type-III domain-containing protein n=1 Tax=Candidula unifasciata TaxID=100452 RepID=A0A8S3ZIG7_9EUPU|nr:unnamed protein product [Candidula unifasciata]